jgi:cell division protein YceG involved in septum cleavage
MKQETWAAPRKSSTKRRLKDMKSKLVVSLLVIATVLCPAFAFATVEQDPMAVDETVVVAEDAATGDVVGEAAEVDELYAPATAKDIKAEAKEEIKEVKEGEKEALKEAKM